MIFCFSACGNTATVAGTLSGILCEKVVRINSFTENSFDIRGHKRVIWAFPVYSWGIPIQVRKFIRDIKLTGASDIPHFMLATCGDDAGLTADMWRKEITKRGWTPKSAHTVIMPNTYVFLPGFDIDSHEVTAEKLARMPERVKEIAHAVKCCSAIDSVTKGKFAWLKTHIIYPLFMQFLTSPKLFDACDSCTSCGKCSRVCPMGNVSLVNGKPIWSDNCTMCLACYHHCPHKSISYGNRSKGKGQYIAPHDLRT